MGRPLTLDEIKDLYEAYKPSLFRTAGRLVGEHAAEDLVHDAFYALLRGADRGIVFGDGNPKSYLFTALINLGKNLLRQRHSRWKIDSEAQAAASSFTPSPEEDIDLRLALAHLPDDLYVPLVLTYFAGFDGAEVAGFLGINQAAARKRLQRARIALDARLQSVPATPTPEVYG